MSFCVLMHKTIKYMMKMMAVENTFSWYIMDFDSFEPRNACMINRVGGAKPSNACKG